LKVVGYIWKKSVVGAIFLFWAAIPVLVAQNTYYSYQSGNWDVSRTWTTDPSGTTLVNRGVPASGDAVVILNGRTVTIPTGVQANVSSLVIQQGAVLDLTSTFNHNFGDFSGSGLLRLSPTTSPAPFPAFATGNFVQAGGGTIEYYVGPTLPPAELQFQQLIYNNLVINLDQSSRIVYPMADMTINGNLAIKKGTFRICDNSVPASDLRLTIDVKGDVNVGASGEISVGTRATNTSYLPFAGAPFAAGTPDTGYVAGSKVSRYYDIYHKFYIGGSLNNNGTVKFISKNVKVPNFLYYTPEAAATVRFYGAHDANLFCNGTTDFYNLIVDKGSDQTYRLNLDTDDPAHFRLYGRNDQPGGSRPAKGNPELRKALWIKNGTLRLTGYATLPSLSEGTYWSSDFDADFYIPSNGALILDGPNVTVMSTADNFKEINAAWGFHEADNTNFNVNPNANCSSFSIYGKLIVNDGYLSGRNSGGFIFWSVASGLLQINGGTVDATQIRSAHSATGIASFIQTGGILNLRGFYLNKTSAVSSWNDLRTVPVDFTNHSNSPSRALQAGKGTLNIEDPENLFTMTGGIMNIYDVCDQSSGDLVVDIKSESQNIKVTGGTINIFSSSGLAEKIATTAPFGNLSITRTAGNAPVILGKNLNVLGNLSINSSALFDAASFDVAVGGDFTIQNNAVYTPGSNNSIFNGNRGQSFIVGGTINGGLNNLDLAKGSNTILSNNITVNGNLSIDSACILNDGGYQINIGSDGIATNNLVNNSGRHVSSLNGGIIFNGKGNQIIGGSGNGIWGNLNLNKTGGAVMFSSDQTINGDLRLANSQGILNIGSFRLSLSGNSHVYDALTGTSSNFNAGRMILTSGNRSDGGLNK
ncbi:MAG: hypothetical protein Q8905_11555, partial [Bacteroidota bacterium]|nr:hypothetical protein [Bacteroidota bacterium]